MSISLPNANTDKRVPGKNKAVRGREIFEDICRILCRVPKSCTCCVGRGGRVCPLTASSMRLFRCIELHGFGKPVAIRFIARKSRVRSAGGIDATEDEYYFSDGVDDRS